MFAACGRIVMHMPSDEAILLSMVNMKLRDGVSSPEELCAENDWDEEELYRRLAAAGYSYDDKRNAFVYIG